ncbi:MAG: glycosyltransferase family 2 protein [Anaerolineales bacterium]
MSFVIILSTLGMVLGLFVTWLVHSRGKLQIVVDPHADPLENPIPEPPPLISVIVPARNEGRNIRRCVQALLRQTYPNFEIIVVDDRSTDETPHFLMELEKEDARLHVFHGTDLPPGWAGKPHALVQGAIAARGEWLCFVDADTFAVPQLLGSTFRLAIKYHADLFSILTDQDLGSFWEKAILPLVFLGLSFGFPAERVNDPTKPEAISNGQFILIKRNVYEQIGGHTAVKDRVDEDKAIAILVKRAGYRLILADGRKVARTRMYTSLPEMWEGWTKNIYLGLLDRLWLLLFGALLGLMVSFVLPFWLLGGLVWLSTGGGGAAAVVAAEAIVLWGYLLWKRLQACRVFGIPGGYAFTFPLGALIFTAMMFASAFNVISGRGVLWKGRRYH